MEKLYNVLMMIKYAVFAALVCYPAAGASVRSRNQAVRAVWSEK